MENTEIKDKLESIEILLSAFINSANDPKKKKAEGEVLEKAIETINATQKELSGLISQEKALIQNFKPTYEVKKVSVNVKEPLWWIGGAMVVIAISIVICYAFWDNMNDYRNESAKKDNYYMQYRWMLLFGGKEVQQGLKEINASYVYKDNKRIYDNETTTRERELREAFEASENARLNEIQAKKLRQKADSLKNKH